MVDFLNIHHILQLMVWTGIFVSFGFLLLIATKNLPIALIAGSLILGLFTLPLHELGAEVFGTLSDPSIIALAFAVAIIPLIGGIMKHSGEMDDLVDNLRIGKKLFLGVSPALIGMLPMPGGALLSAPMVEKAGPDVGRDVKVGANVWFRHVFILIYPLSPALIASSKMADVRIYAAIWYVLPFFALSVLLGYLFFLKNVKGNIAYKAGFSAKKLLLALSIVLLAPFLDFLLKKLFAFPVKEVFTLIAVLSSLGLAIVLSKKRLNLREIAKEMRPWKFGLIMVGMFMFLNVFKASPAATLIATVPLSEVTLCVLIGFALGVVTGRVQLPASIVIPIYLAKYGSFSPFVFAVTYFSIFMGYMISPVHPCVSVTVEYCKTSIKSFLKKTGVPAVIALAVTVVVGMIWL